jgi:hypothetical protein
MAILFDTIDGMCRKKQRDVLFIRHPFYRYNDMYYNTRIEIPIDAKVKYLNFKYWTNNTISLDFVNFLKTNNIGYEYCLDVGILEGGNICIYIDVPHNKNNPNYQLLEDYLENPDGSMKHKELLFCYIKLDECNVYSFMDDEDYIP